MVSTSAFTEGMQAGSSYDLLKDQDFEDELGSFENQDIL